jgi:hypothetical protein
LYNKLLRTMGFSYRKLDRRLRPSNANGRSGDEAKNDG